MEETIWTSESANSPFGQCPLRFAMENETTENSLREGKRLEAEVNKLKSFHENGKEVAFECLPTEVDGKVKFVWSENTPSMQNCYVCGSKPKDLAKRDGPFTPNRKTLFYGFSNLHVKMRAFDWGTVHVLLSQFYLNFIPILSKFLQKLTLSRCCPNFSRIKFG